ncbi:efflux RND transporter periplasmic adaptor subunit [Novosphingobium sp. ZW T3_23]|uniref:efflux RND transporter periplasmic adaptor subunit n=1 Tax=Novosphingobium sp. ZW T3_23 TaxID=3378084 RepID=UPI003851E731
MRVRFWTAPAALAVSALAVAVAGCQQQQAEQPLAPVEVLVAKVEPRAVALTDELPGRVVAYRVAEIRPQVGGIVQQRFFEQGAAVRAGQPLFQIAPAPFRADAASAGAALKRAQATLDRARVQVERLKPLIGVDAISRQSYDDAVMARDQAAADVAQADATLDRRRLDLGFARVTSPIAGQIGAANVTEGALVAVGDANALATVQQIDRVYVDVQQPAQRFEQLREASSGTDSATSAQVEIVSASGRGHPVRGQIVFSDVTVDPGTGNAVIRVLVDNPGKLLLPGMFVRARMPRANMPSALTIPQQAVSRDGNGQAQVGVVDSQGRVHTRSVKVGDVVDGRYVVLSGIRAGETVVVVGQDRVQPNTPVKPLPWRGTAASAR